MSQCLNVKNSTCVHGPVHSPIKPILSWWLGSLEQKGALFTPLDSLHDLYHYDKSGQSVYSLPYSYFLLTWSNTKQGHQLCGLTLKEELWKKKKESHFSRDQIHSSFSWQGFLEINQHCETRQQSQVQLKMNAVSQRHRGIDLVSGQDVLILWPALQRAPYHGDKTPGGVSARAFGLLLRCCFIDAEVDSG